MYTNFQEFQPYQRVEYTDLDGDNDATRNLVGEAIAAFTGLQNGLPTAGLNVAPLAIVSNLSSLSLVVGGAGQSVFVQQRYADYCPAVTLTIPPNTTGQVRYDIIAIQYTQIEVNPHSALFNLPSGGTETGTVYQFAEGITLQYVTGGSASFPSPPPGFVTFANVLVPNGATYSGQCQIAVVFTRLTNGFSGGDGAGATQLAVDFVPAPSGDTATALFLDARAFPVGVSATISNGTLTPFEGVVTAVAGNYVTLQTIQQGPISPLLAGSVVTFGGPPGPPGSGVNELAELIDVNHATEAEGYVLAYVGPQPFEPSVVQVADGQTAGSTLTLPFGNPTQVGNWLVARVTTVVNAGNGLVTPGGWTLAFYQSGLASQVYVFTKQSTGDTTVSFDSTSHPVIAGVVKEYANAQGPTDFSGTYSGADTATITAPGNSIVEAAWVSEQTGVSGGGELAGWDIDYEFITGGGGSEVSFAAQSIYLPSGSGGNVYGASNVGAAGGVNVIYYIAGEVGTAPVYQFVPQTGGGVASIAPSGGTEIVGNVILVPSGAALISQSGQEIIIYAPSGGGGGGGVTAVTASSPLASSGGDTPNITLTTPLPIADGGTGTASPGDSPGSGIGISGSWPNETIANTGVLSLTPSGSAALTGAVVLVPSGGTILSESGQEIIIYSPPSGGGGGGVSSLAPSGGTGITGAVILVPSGAALISQSGQDIIIYAPSGGSGATMLSQLTDVDTSTEEVGYVLTYDPTSEFVPSPRQSVSGIGPSGGATLTLTFAISTQSGNLLVARVTGGSGSNPDIATPSDWTQAHVYQPGAIGGQTYVFTRVSDGTESSVAFAPAAGNYVVGLMEEWANAGTPTGFADTHSSTDSASITVPANAYALALFASEYGVTSPGGELAGWAVNYEYDYGSNDGTHPSLQCQSKYYAAGLTSQYAASNVGTSGGASTIFYIPGKAGTGTPYEFLPIPASVSSIAPSGSTALTGAVLLVPSGGTVLTESGNEIIIYSPPSGGSSGVSSLTPSGGTAVTGAIILVPSGGAHITQSGQDIIIYAPSGGSGGGVTSLAPSGGTQLTGAVTLSATGGAVLSQSGNDINIYAPSGGSGGYPPTPYDTNRLAVASIIHYWPLNDSSGTTALDMKGSTNLTYAGSGVTYGTGLGFANGDVGVIFDGAAGNVHGAPTMPAPSSGFTVEWVSSLAVNGGSSGVTLAGGFNSSSQDGFNVNTNTPSGSYPQRVGGNAGGGSLTALTQSLGAPAFYVLHVWHFVYNGSVVFIYCDNELLSQTTVSAWTQANFLAFGAYTTGGTAAGFISGTFAKAALYSAALTDAQRAMRAQRSTTQLGDANGSSTRPAVPKPTAR